LFLIYAHSTPVISNSLMSNVWLSQTNFQVLNFALLLLCYLTIYVKFACGKNYVKEIIASHKTIVWKWLFDQFKSNSLFITFIFKVQH